MMRGGSIVAGPCQTGKSTAIVQVLGKVDKLAAIEVKSGRTKPQGGMAALLRAYPEATRIVVGGSAAGVVTVEDFLLGNVDLPWS